MKTLNNKYSKWYNQLIQSRKLRKLPKGVCFESHHIIPRSLGGDNLKENKVSLLPREHFIAHLLLTKMYCGQALHKMSFAFNRMLSVSPDHQRYRPTSRFYELARRLVGEAVSYANTGKVPWNKGVAMPKEQKERQSATIKKNGRAAWNKGVAMPKEQKERQSATIKKNGRVAWNKGLSKDDPRVAKYAKSQSGVSKNKDQTAWNKGIKWKKKLKQNLPT
jgi:hypothetical protein